jgi:hypothetical protein
MRKPDEYRQVADELEAQAAQAPSPESRQRYHDLAGSYRAVADSLDTAEAASPANADAEDERRLSGG